MNKKITDEVHSVKDLRDALKGLPDEQPIRLVNLDYDQEEASPMILSVEENPMKKGADADDTEDYFPVICLTFRQWLGEQEDEPLNTKT